MEKTDETQASIQSAMPAAGAESAPPAQPPMTPEMQAAMAELGQMQNNPDALQANAEKYGMGQEWKDLTAKMQQMALQNQVLAEQDAKLKTQYEALMIKANGSSTKMMIANVVGLLLGAGGIYAAFRGKADWGAVKKSAATIAGGLGGGLIGGFIGSKIFGSSIEEEYKNLAMQGQQNAVGIEQAKMEMQKAQEPTIMALVTKMVEAKKQAPAVAPNVEPPAAGVAPVAPPSAGENTVGAQNIKLGDQNIKLSDSSIAPPAVQVGSQSIQPRASSFAAEASKPAVAGAGLPPM